MESEEFKRMQKLAGINEIKINPPGGFKVFFQSYMDLIKGLDRSEMFDEQGNYIPELKQYHEKLRNYAENGNEEEKKIAKFALGFI